MCVLVRKAYYQQSWLTHQVRINYRRHFRWFHGNLDWSPDMSFSLGISFLIWICNYIQVHMDIVNRRSYVRYCSDILVRSLVCIYVLYNIHQQHNVCCLCIVIAVKENTPVLNSSEYSSVKLHMHLGASGGVERGEVEWIKLEWSGMGWGRVGWGATQ